MIINLMQLGLFGGSSTPPPSGAVPASRTINLVPNSATVSSGVSPVTAFIFDEAMDPYDTLDFKVDCSGILQAGETIASYSLAIKSEAALLGLNVLAIAPYGITSDGTALTFWLAIDSSDQDNNKFNAGALLPIEVSLTTNYSPARKRQRTIAVRVVQQ